MSDIKQFSVLVETPDGTLGPAEVAIRDEPARLSDLVATLHGLTSGVVALAIRRAEREGRKLSCQAGCGVCCRQLVPLAPAEVFFMVERLLAIPLAERLPILERFQSIESSLAKSGLYERVSSLGETDDNNAAAQAYFMQHLPCPFLMNDTCSIHPWRPIACREYNVTSSPALCADPFRNKIDTVRLYRRMSSGLAKLCAHVAGLPLGLVPLPLLFDYYEMHKEASSRTWPGVALFRQAMGFVLGKKEDNDSR